MIVFLISLTASQILDSVENVLSAPKTAYSVSEMILMNEDGSDREVRKMAMWRKGEDFMMTKFLTPSAVRGVGLLIRYPDSPKEQIHLYLPAFRKVRRIASHAKKERFQGTDFSYSDMASKRGAYKKDYDAKLISETNKYYVLELHRKPESKKDYKILKMWVLKENYLPEKIEFYDDAGNLWKVMTNKGYKKIGKYWVMTEIEMWDKKRHHKTIMKQVKIEFDKEIPDNFFSIRYLKQPPREDDAINGEFRYDKRFLIKEKTQAEIPFHELMIKYQTLPKENIEIFVSTKFRFWDKNLVYNLSDLSFLHKSYPYEFSVWEAYCSVTGFLLPNLDFKIGKQRIAWGTADKLCPTDNLNPDDFSDIVKFGEKIPTEAMSFTYWLKENIAVDFVTLPSIKPVLMPKEPIFGDTLQNVEDTLIFPEKKIKNMMYAVKLKASLEKIDFSFSFFKGYDDFPYVYKMNMVMVGTPPNVSYVPQKLYYGFLPIKVVGADFRSEILKAGIWGEFALFLPKKDTLKMMMPNPNPLDTLHPYIEHDSIIFDKPYLKYTLGFDYTLPFDIYMNCQWMHGFFTERNNLTDFFMTRFEREFKDGEYKLGFNIGGQIADWDDIKNNYGWMAGAGITFKPHEDAKITIGAFFFDGKGKTFFTDFKDKDMIMILGEFNF